MNCANLYCDNELTDFEIEKQVSRQNKYIFCKNCRTNWVRGRILYWKCKICPNILTSVQYPLNKKFCSDYCKVRSNRNSLILP